MRRGIQICKNLSAVLSALRTIIDWIFYKLDDRRTFWSYSSSSSCQSIIAPVGARRSQGRAKSRNTFIDNWVCDQIIRGSRVGWFKTRADFLLCTARFAQALHCAHSLASEFIGKRFLSMKWTRWFQIISTHSAMTPDVLICLLVPEISLLPNSWANGIKLKTAWWAAEKDKKNLNCFNVRLAKTAQSSTPPIIWLQL